MYVNFGQRFTVDKNLARGYVVEAFEKGYDRGLAASGRPDESDVLAMTDL